VPGSINAEADAESRGRQLEWACRDPDDWVTEPWLIEDLFSRWGACSVDRFASASNTVCPSFNEAFYSGDRSPELIGRLNAMTRSWRGVRSWIVPPWHLLGAVVRKLAREPVDGIMLAPTWPSAPWWPLLCRTASEMREVGKAAACFRVGPSGLFEPGRNPKWTVTAVRLSQSRTTVSTGW
jgi:hypothetical protein